MTVRKIVRKGLLEHPKINPYKYSRERILQPYRISTGKYRVLPDFIILGEPRCGTTSLYYNLIIHPDIFPGSGKSTEFFTKNFQHGINYYRSHFDKQSFKIYLKKIVTLLN